ncbi:uncharacterized protein [Drosophila takahashii]|uniref:uncharacterized protein n=1 Tax=Drosophila takahashii TaxID=29030 RepID=UPI001CF8C982|nr:uncharacterized protein LOC123003110 [Drosophila takahashii]
MKYTILALAVGLLCVNALVPSPNENTDSDVKIEAFSALGLTYRILEATLRSIKGFNCVLKWVGGIEDSALQFNADVESCGATASQDVTNLINANLKIVKTCDDIVNLKSKTCASVEDEEPKVSSSCVVKTAGKVWSLKEQVESAIALAEKIPKTGPNAVVCVSDAVNTLTTYYTAFPKNMVICSQLTS